MGLPLACNAQFPAQQLRQQRVAQRGEGAGLGAVGFGLFKEWGAGAVEGFENLLLVGQLDLHGSDDFGSHSGIGSAVRHLAEVIGDLRLGERGVEK